MKRRTNQQRLVAGLTTLALVVTQVPTAAIAEVVNEGQETAVTTTQTQEEGQVETQTESSDEATVEVVEPEQSAEAEQVSDEQTTEVVEQDVAAEENVAEQTADAAAISLASEPALQVADTKADLELNIHGGKISNSDLYKALKGAGLLGKYGNELRRGDDTKVDIRQYWPGSVTLLSGTYRVYSQKKSLGDYTDTGKTVQVKCTQKVDFSVSGCAQGAVENVEGLVTNLDDSKGATAGSKVTFTVKDVEGYKVASVKVGNDELPFENGKYSLTVGNSDVEVKVTYKADNSSFLTVETQNSTVKVFDTTFDKNSHDAAEVLANTEGTLTVTPDEGYAVISVKYETPNGTVYPELSFKGGVATATIKSPVKDAKGILTVETKKCGLVATGENVNVGLAACDSSEYESLIFNTAIDTKESIPSGLTAADLTTGLVKIQYLAYTVPYVGTEIWEDLDFSPNDLQKLAGYHAFNAEEGSEETIKVTFAGNDQYAGSSVQFKVTSTDDRTYTNTIVNNPVTIQYDANKDIMKASLFAQLDPKVYIQGDKQVDGITYDDFVILDAKTRKEIDPNDVVAGEHTVIVKFKGTKSTATQTGLRPSEMTVTVKVKKAPSSVSVASKNETYDGTAKSVLDMVSSDPSNDETKPVVFTAGVDGDGEGYVSIDFALVNSKVQDVFNKYLHLDKGITVGDLSSKLNDQNVVWLLQTGLTIAGVKDPHALIENLKKVASTLSEYGLSGSTIYVGGAPSNAGVYLVTAVTTSGNYKTSMGMGYLYIKRDSDTMNLSFIQEMDDKTMSPDVAEEFNYGVTVSGLPQGQTTKLIVTFAGTTYAGKPYLKVVTLDSNADDLETKINEAAPTGPGVYTQTVVSVRGNYNVTPLFRAYAIERVETSMVLDDFEDGCRETVYNGEQQPVTATVYDAFGNPIDDAYVTYLYSGTTLNGETITLSPYAPSEAGEYTVKAIYWGDANYDSASVEGTFTIKRADVKFSLVDLTPSYYGDEVDHRALIEYMVDGKEGNGLLSQDQVDAILDTLTCSGDEANHNANADGYDLKVTVPADVAADKNLNITVEGAKHVVLPVELTVGVADATKIAGQDDPEFSCTLYTADGEELDNQEELLKALNVKLDRVEGEDPGEYVIFATWTDGNYVIDEDTGMKTGTLTILPSLTVETDGNGTASADKPGAAKGEKVTVTAKPVSDDYVFGGWVVTKGDATVADATSAQTTVTMGSENATVTANFIAKTKISVIAGEGGTAYATPNKGLEGETIKLVATANDGYVFSGWEVVSGDITIADVTAAETSFVLGEKAVVINALFKKVVTPAPVNPTDDNAGKKQETEAKAEVAKAQVATPNTGDVINTVAPVTVFVVAAIVIAGAILMKRKNQ